MRTPDQIEAMVPASERGAQRFPQLRKAELDVVQRFANDEARKFAPEEVIFQVGERNAPAWFIFEGSVDVFGRDGLNREVDIQKLQSGQFTGELNQLADKPRWVGRAPEERAAPHYRSMLSSCAL